MKLEPLSLSMLCLAALACTNQSSLQRDAPKARVLDAAMHHLGDSKTKWPEVPAEPKPGPLVVEFDAKRNDATYCLIVRQRHVNDRWWIELNGQRVGELARETKLEDHYYEVPAGSLRDGRNVLRIVPTTKSDDIAIGQVRLHDCSMREALVLRPVRVAIRDPDGQPVPARITITNAAGELVPVFFGESEVTAVRDGIVYTSSGSASFEVSAGRYRLHATRGPEWSLASADVLVEAVSAEETQLTIRREVDTTGFVGCDSHVHTLTHSGHGDASVQERLVTLAAEGVELAIATDHNHNTDYRPEQERLGLGDHFTSVVGNEVTTPMGHFNAFPLDPKDKVPEHRLTNWIKLIEGIRAKGAKVVMLNHPRWPSLAKGPFGRFRLNRLSGERATGPRSMTFDTMELANSGTLTDDPLYIFTDWFALLNHGERIVAAGTSDSHTVGNVVGQGRTYLASRTDDPKSIDVDEACESFLKGRCSVSLGIFADLRVDGRYGMGDSVPVRDAGLDVELHVRSASWIKPKLARVFLNGRVVAHQKISVASNQPTDQRLRFSIAKPAHDGWLVCIVTGDGVSGAYWRTQRPYTLAATNPVWLDANRDGRCDDLRTQARALLDEHGPSADALRPILTECDDALCIQVLAAIRRSLPKERAAALVAELAAAMPARDALRAYVESLTAR